MVQRVSRISEMSEALARAKGSDGLALDRREMNALAASTDIGKEV